MTYDVIIVGGGPAGLSAALYCARANLATIIIERMFAGGQMLTTDTVDNYPGFTDPISGFDLGLRLESQVKKFGASIVYENVTGVQLNGEIKAVNTDKNTYQGRVMILCMGAFRRQLKLPRENELTGAGISYCAICDGAFYRDKDVAVIGGGDTAAEDVIYLSRLCRKVYLVHRRSDMRAAKSTQDHLLKNNKIVFVWDSVVEEIDGASQLEGIKVRNVKTDKITDIRVEGMFIAIGLTPNTDLVKGAVPLSDEGYILTDEKMQTGVPGVFAAGDIREKTVRQIVTAASDGAIAAYMAEKHLSAG